jgi:hypothetical protein
MSATLEPPSRNPDVPRRLLVGLIVQSTHQLWNVHSLVEWARSRTDISITHLLIDPGLGAMSGKPTGPGPTAGFPTAASRRLFRLLRGFESLVVGQVSRDIGGLGKLDLSGLVPASIEITLANDASAAGAPCQHAREGFSIEGAALSSIQQANLDLLVSFGPGRPCEAILQRTRLGAISVEHEGEALGAPETAGFWDVYFKRDSTGFAIRWHGVAGESTLLTSGTVRNRFSYLWNQVALFKKSLHYLERELANVAAAGRPPERASQVSRAAATDESGPGMREQCAYLARFLGMAATKTIRERLLWIFPRWSVCYSPVVWTSLDMRKTIRIKNPKHAFLADPFLLEEAGKTYCFAEELDFRNPKGCIVAYELTASGAVRVGQVITEPFHLSFPYIFRHGSSIYMIPESSENRDVRVYECMRVPDRWELRKVIMKDMPTADTMVFEHAGRWWMFTNLDPAETGDFCSELHIFHADHPLSDRWIPHAKNPVLTDARRARNGGILLQGNTIYRVSQRQAFDTYGSGFSINRIDLLTPDDYAESEHLPNRKRFDRRGQVHHMHSKGRFTVFDDCRVERASN